MVYVSTCSGKRRNQSEDAVLVGKELLVETSGVFAIPKNGFVCIADGVGGNHGGAQASQFVLKTLAEQSDNNETDLRTILIEINNALLKTASSENSFSNMATTLTGFSFFSNALRLFHVGNTRAYIRQGNYLKQITSDHTTYNFLLSSGLLDAAEKCNKSEITNCFGGDNASLLSKLLVEECQPFSLALLTSDGVHEYVDLDTLEKIIIGNDGTFKDKCEEIIQKALDAGSEDDLSSVIICPSER